MGGVGSGAKPREYPAEIVELICGMYERGMTVAEIRRAAPRGYRVQTILERYLPRRRSSTPRDQSGPRNFAWKGEDCGYQAAHLRIASRNGPASSHDCVDCGGRAGEWSYRHDDERERVDHKGRAYSTDSSHYDPRCVACHRRFDALRRAKEVMSDV